MKIKFLLSVFVCLLCSFALDAQSLKTEPLPPKMFLTMRDSTTSMDVVFLKGEGGSISIEGKNVRLFNSFFENKGAVKNKIATDGNIMWLINGREFISGSYFLGDSTGCIVFQKDGKEYINQITRQGNYFFKSQIKN